MSQRKRSSRGRWLRLIILVGTFTGFAAAYRFALRYRERVGLPHRSPVVTSPREFGLDFEEIEIPAGDYHLAGWFVPAGPGVARAAGRRASAGTPATSVGAAEQRPGIVVVHGWESNRGRTFAHVRYLHAAGFHCLVFDVRGHGDSPEETLPISVPEFAEDTVAAVRWLAARPEVSSVGVLGHSMGGAGAIVAASREPAIEAVVSMSAPSDLVRMTRQTFELAEMNIPRPIATPMAMLTAAVLLAPRRAFVDAARMPLRLNEKTAGGSGRRKICVTDWDGDGRFDLLVNSTNAELLRQTATRDGQWSFERAGSIASQNIEGHDVSPAVVDFDGDNVPDFLGGAEDGHFYFLANPRGKKP